MARIIIEGNENIRLPRRIGEIFIRNTGSGPVAYLREGPKPKIHPRQQKQMNKFKAATAYANEINNDPEKKKLYAADLQPGESVYLKAMKEYLRAAEPDN